MRQNSCQTCFHIVGKSNHGIAYFNLVKVNAPDNVKFYDFVSHDELARLYQRAKIHILPSWIETPGLSSLEAAAMGCTVVVTDRGDTEWYFGDQAYYVEPGNKLSIRRTIETALKTPIDLSVHVARNYTAKCSECHLQRLSGDIKWVEKNPQSSVLWEYLLIMVGLKPL